MFLLVLFLCFKAVSTHIQIIPDDGSRVLQKGSKYHITCISKDLPATELYWVDNLGKRVIYNNPENRSTVYYTQSKDKTLLNFASASFENEGLYKCMHAKKQESTYYIYVYKKQFELKNETKNVYRGQGGRRYKRNIEPRAAPGQVTEEYGWRGAIRNFVCKIQASPKPNITWILRNKTLEDNEDFHDIVKQKPTEDMGQDVYQSILVVNYTENKWNKLLKPFICHGVNSLGSVNITINITRAFQPESPKVEIEHVEATEVWLKVTPGNFTSNMPLLAISVEVLNNEGNLAKAVNFTLEEKVKVTGLNQLTLYKLKVAAMNLRGKSEAKVLSFNTTKAPPTTPSSQASTLQSQSETALKCLLISIIPNHNVLIFRRFYMIFILAVISLITVFVSNYLKLTNLFH